MTRLSWKDEAWTRKTRPTAADWCSWPERLHATRAPLFFELKRKAFSWTHPLFGAAMTRLSWKGQPCTRKTRPTAADWCSWPELLRATRAPLFFELKRKAFFWTDPLFRAAKGHLSWKGQPCTRKTRPAGCNIRIWWWTQLELSFCCLRHSGPQNQTDKDLNRAYGCDVLLLHSRYDSTI